MVSIENYVRWGRRSGVWAVARVVPRGAEWTCVGPGERLGCSEGP